MRATSQLADRFRRFLAFDPAYLCVAMLSALLIVLVVCTSAAYGWFPSTYPQYCSKNVESKEIPALSADELALVTELKQVQVMIRHGARTPYGLFSCWKDYDVIWNNCNVTELMMESPSYSSQQRPASWLFRKLYDGSANYLGGNCLTGQLLLEGYQQEEHNGVMLYNAYIDGALPLFATNKWEDVYSSTGIYLRSDDEQRTLMSGQILMHTLFNVSCAVYYLPSLYLQITNYSHYTHAHTSSHFTIHTGDRGDHRALAHRGLQPGPDLPQQ